MKSEIQNGGPESDDDSKWGLIIILAFLIGVPLLGILARFFAY